MASFYVSQELKNAIARQLGTSFTLIDQAIQSLEETGNFPQSMATLGRSLNQYFPSGNWKNEILTKSELRKQDPSNLTDEELQSRVDAIKKETAGESATVKQQRNKELREFIFDSITKRSTGKVSPEGINEAARQLANSITEGSISDPNIFKKYIGNLLPSGRGTKVETDVSNEIWNHISSQGFPYYKGEGEVTSDEQIADLKRLTDIQSDRANVQSQEAEVTRLEQSIPGMLAQNREAFYGKQREQAKDYITGQYAPQIVESLGARGLADSGEVGVSIASKYSELQNTIDQQQLQQQNAEFNFWANQAYQATFDKLIQSRTNVAGEVANVQQTALQTSSRNFAKAQTAIQDKFNLDLWRQENARALNAYEKQNQAKQDALKRGQEAELFSAIGGAVGSAAGYATFGPAGGFVGGGLGSAAGSAGSRFLG